jgi:spermidine/putrescine transport system ATP-binding protein
MAYSMNEQSPDLGLSSFSQLREGLRSLTGRQPSDLSASNTFDRTPGCNELGSHGICKSFDDVQVLHDITFSVNVGEFVTLLGPSGCGKTTLLRIIAGLELPDRGRVVLCGTEVTGLPANRRPVNTVFQNYALFPHLSVYDNVAFGLRSRRFSQSNVDDRVGQVLAMLQLDAFAKRYSHQLSGGQKQRVALARALVNEPEVLLLDEPMSALDAKLRSELQIELRQLQKKLGKTFILVTHDQDEAMTVSDRIIVMRDGRIVQTGTPSEVYERPVNRFVAEFLGSANLIPASIANGRVETALGPMVVRPSPNWQRGTLAIRPERIRICTHRPEVNAVSGRVREVIYRGDHLDVFLDPGLLRVRTAPTMPLRGGQQVWLELSPEHLHVLAD